MGFTDWFNEKKSLLAKKVGLFAGDVTPNESMPTLPNWFFSATLGMPRGINFVELRQYAKSCWVQMVINAICKQIMTTNWNIVNTNEEEKKDRIIEIELVKDKLLNPNRNGDTFWDIWIPFLRDILELDAGIVFKGKRGKKLVELFPYDSSRFLLKITPEGIIEGYYQYSFMHPRATPKFFEKDEILYGKINSCTETFPYGFSPLQSIQQEVELMIQSTRYNKEFFKNNAIPDGIISVPMDIDQLRKFKVQWETEVKNKPHKLLFHNTTAGFTPLKVTNREMEWLEGQKWYFHTVFAAYGLSPQEVGFYEDSNRATGESQERLTVKNAIKPYLTLIESKINKEIIPELTGNNDVKFKWFVTDSVAEKIEHDQTMAKLQSNVYTINEIRVKEGLDPVEWGDKPFQLSMQENFVKLGGKEKFEGSKEVYDRDEKKKEKEEERQKEETKKEFDFIDEEEADDYADFLRRKFEGWEKEINSFLDKTLKDEISKDYEKIDKSLGEFMQRLFNTVNTSKFIGGLKKVIRVVLKDGLKDAEEELNMDIGISDNFEQKVQHSADRQLDGFYIDGKRWGGIKGVANDVRNDIMNAVRAGLNEKKGLTEIKKDIKKIMTENIGGKVEGEVTEGRAMKIARTETNRLRNESRLKGYKDSGLKGKKKWVALIDEHTTDICKRLNGQTIGLNELFKDPDTGKEFSHPPALPHCRSILQFIFD